MKIHKTRIHNQKEIIKCGQCDYKTVEEKDLESHIKFTHVHNKNEPITFVCIVCKFEADSEKNLDLHIESDHSEKILNCNSCAFKTNASMDLNQHTAILHKQKNKRENSISPSSSPPRKKIEIHEEQEEYDVEMIDLEIEAHDMVQKMLSERIKQLEKQIERDIVYKRILQEEIKELKKNLEKAEKVNLEKSEKETLEKAEKVTASRRPNCIGKVHEKHVSLLRGYKLRYKATPDGACLTNCFAVHAYEDEDEGPKVKRMINNHMADNWENVYKDKIPLPYVETVGVGKSSKVITKSTKEEMIQFLRSDESLIVFSNSHELLAIATVFNININVFTFGGIEDTWSQITPEPSLVDEKALKLLPDMDLYHSFESHYDLLVKDDSRIVNLGPLAGSVLKTHDQESNEFQAWNLVKKRNHKDSKSSKTVRFDCKEVPVPLKKRKLREQTQDEEKVLVEGMHEDMNNENDKHVEELTLLTSKQSGYRRISQNQDAEKAQNHSSSYKCNKCDARFQSNGVLNVHMAAHAAKQFSCDLFGETFETVDQVEKHMLEKHNSKELSCDSCGTSFQRQSYLEEHIRIVHNTPTELDNEWNCNDCPFQANIASHLMKHLKITSHQPSPTINNRKALFLDYKQCYTCKQEFDGYWNLMNHRKIHHPSNKKCNKFPQSCTRGKTCWYVHDEDNELEQNIETESTFKCNVCDKKFESMSNFMMHKKEIHTEMVSQCEEYRRGYCKRGEDQCWFLHHSSEKQVFHQGQSNWVPPDQVRAMMDLVTNLQIKMEQMQEQITNISKI